MLYAICYMLYAICYMPILLTTLPYPFIGFVLHETHL